ncbi:class I SAM-dependent methyltransferase [Magnetococcus sp. PR-3]|uniref:class I SAM-dependent methyltransferase n=1 Tax=Magnetococcus sp. PR-3 TaxID=3120355 RepID=UPI002FCE1570
MDANLQAEAAAFDARIRERIEAGFIPDLRRAVKCDYFYKSFWRDPQFIRLYVGAIMDGLLARLHNHCGREQTVLDVGCGAGYMSLELARHGHHVTAIDISQACIEIAEKMRDENPFTEGFGTLTYKRKPFEQIEGQYDVVMFSVSMHHMLDLEAVVAQSKKCLKPGGYLLCYEPAHERFLEQDAAQVALIRGLLSLTGHWYEPDEALPHLFDAQALTNYVAEIHREYIEERDKSEPDGQSPNDQEADGNEILQALRPHFKEVLHEPGISFIYRLLGGIRGDEETVAKLADFIATYDRMGVANGYLNENGFYWLGQK